MKTDKKARIKTVKKINPLELVQEQYQLLKERFRQAADINEKKILIRRLINLQGVKQFLLSTNNYH